MRAATCYRARASADDLLVDHDLATKRETLREPAKRWRNWYRAGPDGVLMHCSICGAGNIYRKPGDVFPGHCRTFPSKDTAETFAARILADVSWPTDYVGAFPADETP